MKRSEARGEAVYLDTHNMKSLSIDGIKDMKSNFHIIRLNRQSRATTLKRDELISYLFEKTTFLDFEGLSPIVRQLISRVSSMSQGMVHPYESFKPRTNLSL